MVMYLQGENTQFGRFVVFDFYISSLNYQFGAKKDKLDD